MYKRFSAVSSKGFTLIELLVVISIISLLSSVVLASVNSARVKARDARRASDMHQIVLALNLFYDKYGCLPVTYGTSCAGAGVYLEQNAGWWDYSSQGDFMTFLKDSGFMSSVPVDPVNNMTGDASPAGTFAYQYYCYPDGPVLGYWKESSLAYTATLNHDSSFVCK